MPQPIQLKSKICLVGEKAVGKTSLIRRYVLDQFDDVYIRTLGAKVTKKTMRVDLAERGARVDITLSIWDVIGHIGFRQLLGDSFFEGAQGILAVTDLTRRDTLPVVARWVESVESIAGVVPILVVANKEDLKRQAEFGQAEVAQMAKVLGSSYLLTSAKTGENVEEAFLRLGTLIAKERVPAR